MATAVEVNAGVSFRFSEAKASTEFCDVCKRHLNQNA